MKTKSDYKDLKNWYTSKTNPFKRDEINFQHGYIAGLFKANNLNSTQYDELRELIMKKGLK